MGTTKFITSPAPGTTVSPIHNYTEEQQAQLGALREVVQHFLLFFLLFVFGVFVVIWLFLIDDRW